jgi:hypothetical protein
MDHQRILAGRVSVAMLLPVLTGCTSGYTTLGAPSFILFGAYFPAWMFCAAFGIIGAVATRVVMVTTGLSELLPFQLFVCASAGLMLAIAAWLFWFGH